MMADILYIQNQKFVKGEIFGTCAYQEVRNVHFSENLACFVFFVTSVLQFARLLYYRKNIE